MILEALYRYYERMAEDLPPAGYGEERIDFVLDIDSQGRLVGISDLREQQNGQLRGRRFVVPTTARTSAIVPRLLWDNAEYVLGLMTEGRRQALAERKSQDQIDKQVRDRLPVQRQAFAEAVDAFAEESGEDPGVVAVQRFLASDGREAVQRDARWPEIDSADPALAFRLDGDDCLVCQRKAVRKALAKRYAADPEAPEVQCLITGEVASLERLHPNTRNVPGGQSSGVSLVSFNFDAAESYGKEQGAIAPVGKPAVFGYTTALQTLIRAPTHHVRCGDSTVVFWAERAHPIEESFAAWFNPPTDDPAENAAAVQALYTSPWTGSAETGESATGFFILALAPNAGRAAVRFWHRGTVAEVAQRFRDHFDDLAMVRHERQPRFLAMWQILKTVATGGKLDRAPPNLGGEVLAAVIRGTPYPRKLLALAVQRALKERDVTYQRAAVIKAVLRRQGRFFGSTEREVGDVLDKENTNPGYRLGRLFALLERIQEAANPNLRTTIRGRYYGSASTTPLTVFPHLMGLKNHHLDKLGQANGGLKQWYERQLDEVVSGLEEFPAHLMLDDQGRFAVGYHHQRRDLFTRKAKDEPTDAPAEAEAETEETND